MLLCSIIDGMEIYLTKICKQCDKTFTPDKKHPYAIYCKPRCREKFNHRKKKDAQKLANSLRMFICTICKIEYKPVYSYQKTCAKRKCVQKAYYLKINDSIEYKQKHSLWQRNRKHKIRANGGNLTIAEWEEIKKRQNYTCNICGRKEPEIKLTMDHVIAIKNKGKHEANNIQGLCISCNARKD